MRNRWRAHSKWDRKPDQTVCVYNNNNNKICYSLVSVWDSISFSFWSRNRYHEEWEFHFEEKRRKKKKTLSKTWKLITCDYLMVYMNQLGLVANGIFFVNVCLFYFYCVHLEWPQREKNEEWYAMFCALFTFLWKVKIALVIGFNVNFLLLLLDGDIDQH